MGGHGILYPSHLKKWGGHVPSVPHQIAPMVLAFITKLSRISFKFVCLSLSFLMHRMLDVGQPVLEHCDPLSFNSVLLLLNLGKDLSPEQFVTIKLRNKTPRGWIDRPRTTNIRQQTSNPNAALSFSCCFTLGLLG